MHLPEHSQAPSFINASTRASTSLALMATTLSHLYLTQKLYQPSYTSLFTLSSVKHRTFKVLFCLSLKQSNDRTVITHDSSVEKLRVVFAAGGTGGHIYPAIAIADELKVTKPTTDILFIGTPNSMESDAILSAGYEFATVPAARLARPILSLRNVLLPYHLIKCTIQSYEKLSDFKPHIVVGTGGYVSFPICLAAVLNGIKLVIQEQNSVPGIANWVLSQLANVVFVAFNSTLDYFPKGKCVVSGNPVRLSLKKYVSKAVARLHFFPKSGKIVESEAKVLIILGGSLGANAINIAMLNIYSQMLLENNNLFIIWQTGVEAYNEMESLVKNQRHLFLTPFMHCMDLAYAAADLIISRAGAMTCYEILATGKPSILVPSPDAAEGHQFKNASLMADLADARVITEDELDSTTLGAAIEEILGDENKMADMSERALKAANPHASTQIVQHILSLVDLSTAKEKQQSL